jgi:hypothetical protein
MAMRRVRQCEGLNVKIDGPTLSKTINLFKGVFHAHKKANYDYIQVGDSRMHRFKLKFSDGVD